MDPANDRVVNPAAIKFALVSLADVKHHQNEMVDVMGAVDRVDEVSTVNTKAGKVLSKRTVNLVDDSKTIVQLTLWEDEAHNFEYQVGQVIAIKGASVREFNGECVEECFHLYLHVERVS